MKILITGGAGFIGINFIHYMLKAHPHYHIVCIDKLTYASNITAIRELVAQRKIVFVKGDICNKKLIDKLCSKYNFDAIINFAAQTHVDRSITDSRIFFVTNVLGTQVLLDACNKYQIPHFHQVSTDEVYGDVPLDCQRKLDELSPLKPSNPYSASKASADLLALSYYRTYNTPITISRSSNNYGLYQHKEKLIPMVLDCVAKGQSIPIYGTGKNIRNWVHAYDHSRAIDMIINSHKMGQIYNIGTEESYANIELVQKILTACNAPLSLIKLVDDRKGHDLKYSIDYTKIQQELGWQPQYTLQQFINEHIANK